MIDGMIFDVDGTFWDSTPIVEKAWNKAIKDSNIEGVSISADTLKGLFGLPMDDIIKAIMPDESQETRDRFKPLCFSYEHEFLEREPGILYPELGETLEKLFSKIPLFVVSNCQAGYIELFCRKTGFGKYFKDHLCPGDTGLLKADNIKLIKEKYHLDNPVYVGDTHMDEEACRKAGVQFVFASYGFGHGIKPDYTINTIPELLDIIKREGDKTMKIYSVNDPEFKPYGKVLGYDTSCLVKALDESTPLPEGVEYVMSCAPLEYTCDFGVLQNNAYGGMPIQIGYCNGHNTKLNCLEYHRDSELNIGSTDFILLLAKADDIVDGKLDTSKVKAFLAKKGQVVEVYETSLHYAPCSASKGAGFKVAIVLPKGTNGAVPALTAKNEEDKWMTACNKWLLAHAEASEAKDGAYVGLTGENIDIADLI